VFDERLLRRDAVSAEVEICVPASSDYFDGHFPAVKILPAVAQSQIALRLGDKYFGAGLLVSKARKLKFVKIIRPGARIRLELRWDKDKRALSFTMTESEGRALYSAGSFVMGESRE
jgi:3-hydroxymyristoyl/3-hydroxydecanoyl-(acyl carrier protein) dehydratase